VRTGIRKKIIDNEDEEEMKKVRALPFLIPLGLGQSADCDLERRERRSKSGRERTCDQGYPKLKGDRVASEPQHKS
jgi:hypothetical protein